MNADIMKAVEFFLSELKAERADYDHREKERAFAIVRALCGLGKFQERIEALVEAEHTVEACDSLRWPQARFLIAGVYAGLGGFTKALALIEMSPPWIADRFDFFQAVINVAVRMKDAGADYSVVWEKAQALAEKKFFAHGRQDWYQRMDFYCALAATRRKLGLDPVPIISRARSESIQAAKHQYLLQLAECEKGLGLDPAATLMAAGELPLPIDVYGIEPQVRWLEQLIKLECFALVETVAAAIPKVPDSRCGSSRIQAITCALCAVGFAKRGARQKAEELAELAESHAFAIKYNEPNKYKQYHVEAVLYLVETLASIGQYDRARKVAARMTDASYKHWSDRSQGDGLASIVTCPDDDFRRRTVNLIAKEAADRGDLKVAELVGTSMNWWDGYAPYWLEPYVMALVRIGHLEEASRFCRFFDCPSGEYPKHRCLEQIACAYARVGAYEEAVQTIHSIPHEQDWEGRRYATYAAVIEMFVG